MLVFFSIMNNNSPIQLFHVEAADFTQIIYLLKKHLQQKPLEQLIAIYSGAEGYSVLSADPEIDTLLKSQGAERLLENNLLYYALSKDPKIFTLYYGNKELVNHLHVS